MKSLVELSTDLAELCYYCVRDIQKPTPYPGRVMEAPVFYLSVTSDRFSHHAESTAMHVCRLLRYAMYSQICDVEFAARLSDQMVARRHKRQLRPPTGSRTVCFRLSGLAFELS